MTTLHEAAQQALEALEMSRRFVYADNRPQCDDAIEALRVTLKQEAEATAWLAERKNHWRKEREKAQAAKDQDPELSAALGWPGGISNPALDRKTLLQMVAALRLASQQALEALRAMNPYPASKEDQRASALAALRAALVQQAEPDHETRAELAEQQVVQLAEERDHYRNLWQKAQQAEPVEPVAWYQKRGQEVLTSHPACWGQEDEPWTPLYTAPPQRLPLTEEEIYRATGHCGVSKYTAINIARAVERAHGIGEQS